jgi:hypothetical protein
MRRALRSLLRALPRLSALALVAFHLGLLAGRLADGTLVDPAVAVRWGLAGALAALAAVYRRRGLPLASGRTGVVFWLFALLLHLGGAPLPIEAVEPLLVSLPLGVAAPLALALAALRRTGRAPLAVAPARSPRSARDDGRGPARRASELAARFVARPPPLLRPA